MKIVILIFALVLSMGAAVYFYSAGDGASKELMSVNDQLSSEVEQLKKENDRLLSLRKKSEGEVKLLNSKVSALENLVEKASEVKKEKLDSVVEKEEVLLEEQPKVSDAEKQRSAQMKKFLLKEIDKNYSSLFEELGLSEVLVDSITEKLVERDSEIVSAVFKSILQSLPTEEGQTQEQALAKSILDSIEKANSEISLDLGDSFGEFREQEKRAYTLKELSNFEGVLGEASLGDEQRLGLNDLMFEHHNSVLQNVASGETTFKQADQNLVEKSSEYLNADQQKSLGNYLKMKRGGN